MNRTITTVTKMQPPQRSAYMRGHSDGERGLDATPGRYAGPQRVAYEVGYRRGAEVRRDRGCWRRHGNTGRVR